MADDASPTSTILQLTPLNPDFQRDPHAVLGPLFLPPAALYGVHLSRQAAGLDVRDGKGALKLFKSNSWTGLLLFVALAAGMWKGPIGPF